LKTKKREPTSGGFKSGSEWRGRGSGYCTGIQLEAEIHMAGENLKALNRQAEDLGVESPQEKVQDWIQNRAINICSYLYSILTNDDERGAARVQAAKVLLERGFGAVPQTITMDKKETSTIVTITNPHTGVSTTIESSDEAVKKLDYE